MKMFRRSHPRAMKVEPSKWSGCNMIDGKPCKARPEARTNPLSKPTLNQWQKSIIANRSNMRRLRNPPSYSFLFGPSSCLLSSSLLYVYCDASSGSSFAWFCLYKIFSMMASLFCNLNGGDYGCQRLSHCAILLIVGYRPCVNFL